MLLHFRRTRHPWR